MTDQVSDTFYSLDEFHSFVTYKSVGQLENPNDKSVSVIAQSDQNKPDKSLCLEKDIDCLRFADEPDLQTLQKNIDDLANHQLSLEQRLLEFGEYLSQSRASQNNINSELKEFKSSVTNKCSAETHKALRNELYQTKQMLQQQQTKIQDLMKKKITRVQHVEVMSPPKQVRSNQIESPLKSVPKKQPTQSFTLENNLNYSKQPHFLAFKLCSLAQSTYTLYTDKNFAVKYHKIDSGIAIDLQGQTNYKLKVATLNSTHIQIPWSRFAKGKFVQNCEIIDNKKQTVLSVPIPLPLNFVFQQRLTNYHRRAKYQRLKQMMTTTQVTIKHYDKNVWKTLMSNPHLYKFERQNQTLRHAINLKANRQIFLTEMWIGKSVLKITIGHKAGSSGLRDLLQFYSFVMSQ